MSLDTTQTSSSPRQESGAKSMLEDCTHKTQELFERGTHDLKEVINDKPSQALLVAGLLGLGFGFLLTRSMSSGRTRSSFNRKSAEKFGHRLLDKIEQSLPNAFRDHLSK